MRHKYETAGNALVWRSIQLAGVKGISLIRLLVLARILSPTDFGIVVIGLTIIGLLLQLTNFGLIPALVQEDIVNTEKYNVAWSMIVGRGFIVTLIVFITAYPVAMLFGEPESIELIRILAFQPMIESLSSIKVAELIRTLQFRPLAFLGLAKVLTDALISIMLAPELGVWAIVIGALSGASVALFVSYIVAPHSPRFRFDRGIAQGLLNFGRWIFFSDLIMIIGVYALRASISNLLGAASLGHYYLATRIAFFPGEIANQVIGSVAFPLYARLQNNIQQVADAFQIILVGTSALLYPVCGLLIILAPSIVNEVLGPEWYGTAPLIRILTLVTAISLFTDTSIPIFKGLGRPKYITIVTGAQSITLIALVWVFIHYWGLLGAALAWLPAVGLALILSIIFIKRLLIRPFAGILPTLSTIIVAAILGALITYIINKSLLGLTGLFVAALLGLLVPLTMLLIFDRFFRFGLLHNLLFIFPQINVLTRANRTRKL